METRTRTIPGHTEQITITRRDSGWEVTETRDSTLVRAQRFSDWHRVERALQAFDRAAVNAPGAQSMNEVSL
jgi:hypothetical protein